MKKQGWPELIAASGVILSLVFVGVEVRQNTSVARGQARYDLADSGREFLLAMALDEEWADLWLKAWYSEEELTPTERMRARMGMLARLRELENIFFQVREGFVPESGLRGYGWGPDDFESPQFREWWTEAPRTRFDPEFVEYFEGRFGIAGTDAP